RVADGGSALDPAVVSELVGRKRRDDPLEQLTAREREVLELMAEGRSNQAIAERLFVTLRAVEKHVTSIFTKLGLPASTDDHRRVVAVLAFLRAEPAALGRRPRRRRTCAVCRTPRGGNAEACSSFSRSRLEPWFAIGSHSRTHGHERSRAWPRSTAPTR